MAKRHNSRKTPSLDGDNSQSNAWIMSTKCVGDQIAGWMVERVYDKNTRQLKSSERCDITSFCYPRGVKLVRARLQRQSA
ncbi:hypothetical protein [Oceanicoccus sagamiensis]|uniref:Uncharacterized protein n=1 Tax=Oceanicoccus sagamiensis TaxID=716816 RepID=A0A1X9NE18_9GAMM|nr:hypothetical protein [Oceanicoccus sagamiensis]ARN75806.1 hypothetical protein BST96_17845 [Oceanicoccus sagamiensis]